MGGGGCGLQTTDKQRVRSHQSECALTSLISEVQKMVLMSLS